MESLAQLVVLMVLVSVMIGGAAGAGIGWLIAVKAMQNKRLCIAFGALGGMLLIVFYIVSILARMK
jgi:hypothetical protein